MCFLIIKQQHKRTFIVILVYLNKEYQPWVILQCVCDTFRASMPFDTFDTIQKSDPKLVDA